MSSHVKIHQVKQMLYSGGIEEFIPAVCYFKVVSDRNYRKGHTLLVADGNDRAKDFLPIEFDPSVKADLNARGKMFWPGSFVKGQMLKLHKTKLMIVRNTHLEIIPSSQLPPDSLPDFDLIPVEAPRSNLKLKDLVVLRETTPISENLLVKVTGKTAVGGYILLHICDETERLTLKVSQSSHLPLVSDIQVGDYWRFRNLILKLQESKKKKVGGPLSELFLQNVPKYTLMEKLTSTEITSLPKIPPKFSLGDGVFQGKIIALERFEWANLCHLCPNFTKTSKCKTHEHGPEFDIRSYSFHMIGYDNFGEKKEFFIRKERVETFRNKHVSLEDEHSLRLAFESLLDQPLNIIYNIWTKSPQVYFVTQLTLILNPTTPAPVLKKKKKRVGDEEEKKTKKKVKFDLGSDR